MAVELVIFLGIILYLFTSDKYNLIKAFILLLPFHLFIKNALFYYYDGGAIFAFWKEFAVILLIFKVLKTEKLSINKTLLTLIAFFIFTSISYYLLAKNYGDALAKLRDHLFTILLFLAVYKCPISRDQIKGLFSTFTIAAFVSCIGGFLQQFFFNTFISTVKGSIDFIDSSGYVQYRTVSARIMGFERMSGLFSGPNDFGLYCSFSLCICIYILFSKTKIEIPSKTRILTSVTSLMLVACLILSFSRAGWVISFITIVYLIVTQNIKFNPKIIFVTTIAAILMAGSVLILIPKTADIISASLSGKEASAAARSGILAKGLDMISEEPFGHGLATADNRSKSNEFFVESAFLNITYEIGIIGLLSLIILHLQIIYLLRIANKNKLSPFSSIAIGISLASLVVSFISINPYGMPYIYLWWLILGLGLNIIKNRNVNPRRNINEILSYHSNI